MNFYKIYSEDRHIANYFNLDIVQCFIIDDYCATVDIYYSAKEHFVTPLTKELIKKLKEIGVFE